MSVNRTVASTRSNSASSAFFDRRQEALGLGDHRIAVAHERSVLLAVELDQLGPGDPRRHVPGVLDVVEPVVPPAHHEGGHLHRGEHRP